MFGSDYLLGYSQGRSSAEDERDTNALVARVLYGRRPVQVDQSYLDQLHQLVEQFRSDSDHNFDKADSFTARRFAGRRRRSAIEARCGGVSQAQVARFKPNSPTARDQAQAAIAQERAAHQTTHDEKWGLNLFRLIATWLIDAHIAGRSDRPAFAEMRDMAKDVTDAIQRGEPFRGYRDEPEKKARLQALLEELLRP